jgi:probable addiction module antidote protein
MPASRPYKIGLDERLKDPEYAAAYLNAARKEGIFLLALRDVAEAHKISKVAEQAAVNRESLYRVLSAKGNPTKDTFDKVLNVLGLDYDIVPKAVLTGYLRDPQPKQSAARTIRKKKKTENTAQFKLAFADLLTNTPEPAVFPSSPYLTGIQQIKTINMSYIGVGGLATVQTQSHYINQEQQKGDTAIAQVAPFLAAKLTGTENALQP